MKLLKRMIKISIVLLLIAIVLLVVFNDKKIDEPVSKSVVGYQYDNKNAYVPSSVEHLTVSEIQGLLDRTTADFPADTSLNIRVYDEAHNSIGLDFSIIGKKVSLGLNENADGEFWIGTWYEEKARRSSDICSLINQMKNDQNIKFESKISTVSLMWKYKNLRSCLGF